MTRLEKISELEIAVNRNPSNSAIKRHLEKVRSMDENQFLEHIKAQEIMLQKFRNSGAMERMVKEI